MKPSPIALVRPRRPARKVPPILPPLKLYRSILRAHRRLPAFQRLLGDQYVKSEFHAHKDIDNPLHIVGFLTSWQDYLKAITEDTWREAGLTQDQLNKMSPEQVGQLYELMKETKRVAEDEVNEALPEEVLKNTL